MQKKRSHRYDVSKFRGLDIKSFAVAEATGEDIILAAERCTMPSGGKVDDNTFGLLLRNQMIAGAIVEVDGQAIRGASCQAYLQWNSRTRELVSRAYDHVNSMSAKEKEDFQKLLEAGDEEPDKKPAPSATT